MTLGQADNMTAETPKAEEGFFERLLLKLSDFANPLLVRTIRQELRSKSFLSVFMLLLVVSAMAAIGSASSVSATNAVAGHGLYAVLATAWTLVVAIQAMTTFQAVTRERNEDTWDLIDLTGMQPRQVLRGLLLANLIQGQLYTAALAPFLVMAYLLRGLDLLTIVFALVLIPLAGIAASTLAVFMASIGNNKATRSVFQGILGLGLFALWGMSMGLWFNSYVINYIIADIFRNATESWLVISIILNCWIGFNVLMLVLSGALMTHRAGDRSSGPRLLWFALWLNTLLWIVGMAIYFDFRYASGYNNLAEGLCVFGILGVCWAFVLGLFSVSEEYEISPRQARTITEAPTWRRWATVFHAPGAARGRLAYLLMSFLSILISFIGYLLDSSDHDVINVTLVTWLLFALFSALLVVCDWIYRGFAARWLDSTALRRGFVLVVAAIWMLVPVLLGIAIDSRLNHSVIALFSPFFLVDAIIEQKFDHPMLYIVSLIGIAATAVLIVQGLRLHITTYRVQARADDVNPRGG